MSPARIKPGTIGRIEWDESRTPGKVRGTVRTRDGADKPRRLVAVRDTRDEVEAELKARAAALLYRSDIWSADTTLSEAIERWIATLGDPDEGGAQREQSIETYARTARGVIIPRLGAVPIGSLTAPQLHEFMREMRTAPHRRAGKPKRGYSVSYRLHILRALRDTLSLAVSMGAIPVNPARDVPPPSKKTRGGRVAKQALNREQVDVLRKVLVDWEGKQRSGPNRGPQLRLAIELGLATGCRIGEVCGFLMSEASDVPSPRIAVTGTVITVEGKARRANELKGDEQARILELPAWVRPSINECRAIARRNGSDAPLLQGSRGGLQTPANLGTRLRSLREEYRRELEAVGINVDEFTFHTLRRTVLTAVDEVAGRPYSQAQAGHADEKTTAGYIATPRSLPIITGAVAAIQRSFGGAS